MKQQIKQLTAAIRNNRPALLFGKAGSGKTSTVHAIAKKEGFPVETLLLAGILPEDLGGLVRPMGSHFSYLPPEWAVKYGDKPFILFLDEINQASIQTLHALFYVVNDRTVAGLKLPNMRIIAAGNTVHENEFLTPLPAPLLDRFVYKINWQADIDEATKYLSQKYNCPLLFEAINKTKTENITPRHIEQMLMLIEDKTDDVARGRELIGAAYEVYLKLISSGERHRDDNRLEELRIISKKLKLSSDYEIIDGVMIRVNKSKLLEGLTPEELELVHAA